MVNISTVTTSGTVVPVDGNVLILKNDGIGEAVVSFLTSGETLQVKRGSSLTIGNFESAKIVDTLTVTFTNVVSISNSLDVIVVTATATSGGGASTYTDANGAMEVSSQNTYISALCTMDDVALDFDRLTVSSGGFNYDPLVPGVSLNVQADGDIVVSQGRTVAANIAAKGSGWQIQTIGLNANDVGITKQSGLGVVNTSSPYEVKEGIYLESSKDLSGVQTDKLVFKKFDGVNTIDPIAPILRSSWDDPLDGTGPSTLVWNLDRFSIFEIELVWGGNVVNFYLWIDGEKLRFHQLKWSGMPDGFYALIKTPNQPVFFRIESMGDRFNPSGSDTMTQVGSGIYTSGIQPNVGKTFSIDTGGVPMRAATAGVMYPVLAVEKKTIHCFTELLDYSTLGVSNDDYSVYIVKNPVLATGSFVFANPSGFQGNYSKSRFAVCDGSQTINAGQYDIAVTVSSGRRRTQSLSQAISQLNRLGYSINGTSDIFALVVVPFSSNLDIHASLSVNEIS